MDLEGGFNLGGFLASEAELESLDLLCTICRCVLRDAVQTDNGESGDDPCGHVFCKSCICEWLTNHNSCRINKSFPFLFLLLGRSHVPKIIVSARTPRRRIHSSKSPGTENCMYRK